MTVSSLTSTLTSTLTSILVSTLVAKTQARSLQGETRQVKEPAKGLLTEQVGSREMRGETKERQLPLRHPLELTL